jgi:hypothetical protein
MIGVLWTIALSLLAAVAGSTLIARWSGALDPAERIGLSGLTAFGTAGLVTLLVGVLPNGLSFAPFVLAGLIVFGLVVAVRNRKHEEWRFKLQGHYDVIAFSALVVIGLLALIAVLAPSISTDWDTIAYHLAVPKLWIEHGRIDYVQGIHHSNFPSTMEMLFLWGFKWGGQSGAKAFSLMVYVFGCLSLFGLARRWYGRRAGWWAAIGFAAIPVVAWESGTGYIDVAHGLYAALGTLYAAECFKQKDHKLLVLAGVCLGFALGTKYTGLQMLFAVSVGLASLLEDGFVQAIRTKLTVVLVALVIACPWYIKTFALTGNPVYPFFYGVLGGKDWDTWRADTYSHEQKSFGVGSDPVNLGHAILGLGYQPGRYTNPAQDKGGGFPSGSLGFAALLAGVCAATCGRLRREERLTLAIAGLGFLMWFALSQQSRYLTMLAIPLVVLGAGQVTRVKWGPVVAGAFALQWVATTYIVYSLYTTMQLDVALGQVSRDEYLTKLLPVYRGAEAINQLPADSKVALYDEVFGFYLDRDYFWANPGHSMLIPYESMLTVDDYATALIDLGFTHVYVSLLSSDQRFIDALSGIRPYTPQEREAMFPDLNTRWRVLVADAANQGRLRLEQPFGGAVLYSVVR